MSDDDLQVRPIPFTELPPITPEEQAAWLEAHGNITIVTRPDGSQARIPDPWERGQ